MNKKILLFVLLFVGIFLTGVVKAWAVPQQTSFYLHHEGEPVKHPVDFTVSCDRSFKDSIKLNKTCSEYGCGFDTTELFQAHQDEINFCDIKGKVNGKEFEIEGILGSTFEDLNCRGQDFDIKDGEKYYKKTSEYEECKEEVYREYYPEGDGEVEGKFLCDKYKTKDKLIPTDKSTKEDGPCYRHGYTIKDDTCYKIPEEFFECTSEMDNKEEKCDKHLKDVTDEIEKTEEGFAYEEVCDLEVELPDDVVAGTASGQDPFLKTIRFLFIYLFG